MEFLENFIAFHLCIELYIYNAPLLDEKGFVMKELLWKRIHVVLWKNQLNPLYWLECTFCLHFQIHFSNIKHFFFGREFSVKDKDSPLKVGNFRNFRISFLCSCSHSKIPSPNFWLASHPMYIALYSVSSVSCRFSNP